jgi:riboflavin synthase
MQIVIFGRENMFTGLIQATGTLTGIANNRLQITYHPHTDLKFFHDLAWGDSVAVNGVCLTVVDILAQGFIADASPETLSRSTLGEMEQGSVNLETSLRIGSKLGGHFVTGHVDGVGYLKSSQQTATSWEMSFAAKTPHIARYILAKGSIAVDGVSLTIADCDRSGAWFRVAVIPHTYTATNLHQLQPGDVVNLEGDILGKYVERFLGMPSPSSDAVDAAEISETLTPDFLAEHGYV